MINLKMLRRAVGVTAIVAVALSLGACAQIEYYAQAAQGQFSLLSSARPIDEWLASPGIEDTLKGKLSTVKAIRAFAARELALPDNASYTTYADLNRRYVTWNVVATPELSLKPVRWCFPIAGCVSYRGYYDHGDAQAFAARLRARNYDVKVSGVPAYSTLGWFDDPVLSTFIRYPDAQLARLVFHELAHQVVYVPGDSSFNESFAVAVEEAGVARWLALHGDDDARNAYAAHEGRKHDFLALLAKYRKLLEVNYESDAGVNEKRTEKARIFAALKADYVVLKKGWGGYAGYDHWFDRQLNNADLSAVATYHDLVPGFRALLSQQQSMDKFYEAARVLAGLDEQTRHRQLLALGNVDEAMEYKVAAVSR